MAQKTLEQLIAEADEKECNHSITEDFVMPRAAAAPQPIAAAAPQPIAANCDTRYTARNHSGTRPLSAISLVVIHSTEGSTAAGAAAWFANPASGGSTHLVVDDNICYRTLQDNQIPWGAKGANFNGFHIEQAGFAKWTTSIWSNTHRKTLQRAAFKTALHCKRYGIPIRFVSASGLRLGVSGITTHVECSKAFGGTHYDPGTGWPRTLFMSMVRAYALVIKVKRIA